MIEQNQKSLIDSLEIEKSKVSSYLTTLKQAIATGGKWKGEVRDKDFLRQFEEELVRAGWLDAYETVDGVVDFNDASCDDAALASLYLYKNRDAKIRGIEFNLSLQEMRNILKRKTCFYSGQRFVLEKGHPQRPSLDRIDRTKGYTKANTVACCHWVNQLKAEVLENPGSKIKTDLQTLKRIVKRLEEFENE